MDTDNTVCPVCTLFLRPGITLKEHLASHPKIKVIEALVRLSHDQPTKPSEPECNRNVFASSDTVYPTSGAFPSRGNFQQQQAGYAGQPMVNNNQNQNWQPTNVNQNSSNFPTPVNHSIIYQQIMSSSTATTPSGIPPGMLNMNNLASQYVAIPVPAMFNQQINLNPSMMNTQMMGSPYMSYHQQQQVIMTAGSNMISRPSMDMPDMPRMNIGGVPVNTMQSNGSFSTARSIEAPRSRIIVAEQASRIVEPQSQSRIMEPSRTTIIEPTQEIMRKQLRQIMSKPTRNSIDMEKPSSEMVLIREPGRLSPFNYGPYRAITANPQSGMIIEEIDPLSTTPSPSPTPSQSYRYSPTLRSLITPEPPKIATDPIDITEHKLDDYEEPEVKSPMPDEVMDINISIVSEEETITPDIQCAEDLRTFCKSPVSESSIPTRAPVIASCRSPPRLSSPHCFSPQMSIPVSAMCNEQDDNFLTLDVFNRHRRMDDSLSDPPFDPLTDNIVIQRKPHRGARKSSQDDIPASPASSVGSDWSLRVRKDLQSQPYDDTSQNMDCFSPRGVDSERYCSKSDVDMEQNTRPSNIVICSTRSLNQDDLDDDDDDDDNKEDASALIDSEPNADHSGCGLGTTPEALIDIDGMHLMLSNEFMNAQSLISQVEDFECMNSSMSQARVLMNIGGMHTETYTGEKEDDKVDDENLPRESVNIHADERMPPRGELSEQESNGACDIPWTRMQYQEGSSGMSTSYDFLARESWETSDVSDSEAPAAVPHTESSAPPPSRTYSPEPDDTPIIVNVQEPPLNFKCSTCDKGFSCPKERRLHQTKEHKKPSKPKQPRKKAVPKPKTVPAPVKTENNFDNLFSHKLKLENESTKLEIGPTETVEPSIPVPPPIVQKKVKCELCDETFKGSRKLKEHLKQEHGVGIKPEFRYTCGTCDEKFVTETTYTAHLKIHPLECRICGKYFYRRHNLQLHLKRHMGFKPHKCETCTKGFITKQKLEEHKNTHTGEAPIKCTMCDETFRRHSNLVQHRNRHHLNIKKKVKDYICHCGEIYHSKKKLQWHKEIHDTKPKACTYCSEKFVHMSSLTRHMRRAHNRHYVPRKERETENVECPICKGVYLKSSIESHVRTHSGQKQYQCSICNKEFSTKWNLKLHKWTHASRTSKPFKCETCNGAFIRQTDYVAHMNSHKSVKPYTCNYCGCQFIRKYNCQRHVKEHEEGKSFTCTVCNKTFHRSYYLKEHMRVHTGARPYSCHICGKTSTTKSNHNKHVRIHHAREPVSTEG